MKTFKIAKKTNEVISTAPLDFISGGTSGNDLYVVVKKENGFDLNEGGKLLFEKAASGNSGQMIKVYEESTEIKKIVEDGEYLYVYFEYVYITPLTLASCRNITSPEGYEYKLYFTSDHHMLPCDIDDTGYKVYIKRGEKVIEYSNLAFCFPGELVKGEDICPTGGDCCDDTVTSFNYETMEKNSILAGSKKTIGGDDFDPQPGDQVLFATNPFFHIETIEIDDKKIGKINLYPLPNAYKIDCEGKRVTYGEVVSILKYTDFMGLGVVMEQDYDAKRMFQEYQVNELFVNKIKNSIIPNFIDLEKVKYAPAYFDEDENAMFLATGLTFNLHFRTRVSGTTDESIPEDEAKYYFEDTWHFNDGMNTWNGNGLDDDVKKREDLYSDAGFVNSSNLLGYLGFTDDDVYNQKNRLKQSFIRLSFYDSWKPLEQSLLYYSTIFLDSGDLYGKYVKRKAWLENEIEYYDPKKYPVVWSSASTEDPCDAVTSQLIVNDEYDMTRSGEGFNIYLFREDAPVVFYDPEDQENTSQDIYMKVEFNHAGFGRTVPLIFWPKEKENGEPIKLTAQNYLENLYIHIRISLTERGYVYDFPDVVSASDNKNSGIVWENERLVLNLFEPMIELEILPQE